MHAADEVTRRGREILGQVVAGCARAGLALIEADTDGVFFGVPEGWTEAEERAWWRRSPPRCRRGSGLEYEGRYRAMLSHEVKNYALLTYDGRLIVRGEACRRAAPSRSARASCARRCAARCGGDSAGVRRAYLDTVAALRGRLLAPDEWRRWRG